MCRHNWLPLLPKADVVSEEKRIDYVVERMLSRMTDMVYCDRCTHTGHYIKSHRGGIRRHTGEYFLEKANKLREKYGIPPLTKIGSI